ncbi:MAG: hypothetical protein EOS32_17535 [Mesorhizobium sp.]|nr:MAG: hypothetical protein EOQ27_20405 [Mesorhizobium sp.]RWC94371.1 MAG: hypothetical protein EOS32_17535 [Mesorhizobium sp.]
MRGEVVATLIRSLMRRSSAGVLRDSAQKCQCARVARRPGWPLGE